MLCGSRFDVPLTSASVIWLCSVRQPAAQSTSCWPMWSGIMHRWHEVFTTDCKNLALPSHLALPDAGPGGAGGQWRGHQPRGGHQEVSVREHSHITRGRALDGTGPGTEPACRARAWGKGNYASAILPSACHSPASPCSPGPLCCLSRPHLSSLHVNHCFYNPSGSPSSRCLTRPTCRCWQQKSWRSAS